MTATPHNGKEEDFQLFLSLLDSDRFYGKFRDGVHMVDASDLMRRMVKEELVKFDGTPLFPERRAYTVNYTLSDAEAAPAFQYFENGAIQIDDGPQGLERLDGLIAAAEEYPVRMAHGVEQFLVIRRAPVAEEKQTDGLKAADAVIKFLMPVGFIRCA